MRTRAGPAWPASDDDAIRWLHEHAAEERRLDEASGLLDVVIAARAIGPAEAVATLFKALDSRRVMRNARTSSRRIGAFQADSERMMLRAVLVRPIVDRLAVIALVCAGLAAAAWPVDLRTGAQLAALAVALAFVGRRSGRAIAGLCVSSGAAIAIDLGRWWWCLLGLVAGWNLVSYTTLRVLLRGPWWSRGPVLGMVPLGTRVRLLLSGRAVRLANAIDLATASRGAVAAPFVEAATGMPPSVQPMVEMCSALVTFDRGDIGGALTLAARATSPDRRMPATVRGWCLARLAQILEQSGNPEAGQRRREAIELLSTRACRRYATELRLADATQYITEAPRRDALARIHGYRREALRRGDFDLMHQTELWLARLMIMEGSVEDAAVTLEALVGGEDGRVAMFSARDETANDLLLRATVQLGRLDRARSDPRRDVQVALAMLDANTRPLASTAGRLVLAKLEHAAGRADTALAYAGSALAAAQHGRYMLPSTGWRESWSRTQLDAHATTLALAATGADSALVAEVIELTRGEVLPAVTDAGTLAALAMLDATVTAIATTASESARGATTADATAAALQGLSPVRQPPRVRVGSGLRIRSLDESLAEIALDRELDAIGPRTWYWSATTVLDVCYWAVRDPTGRWSHGRIALDAGSAAAAAYAALLAALPFAQPGEDAKQIRDRVAGGPLGRRAGARAEHALLADAAAAFLPQPIVDGLRAERGTARLVVSLPAALGHLPVAGLPLDRDSDLRIVERATVVHMPSWGVVHAARRPRSDPRPDRWPARLAIVAPHGDNDLDVLSRPEGVQRTIRGPLSRQQCRELLHAMTADRGWLLTIVGHVDTVPGNAAASGLRLSAPGGTPERLTMNDLMGTGGSDQPFEMPERVVLIGCGSIGFGVAPSLISGQVPTSEWLGLGSAIVLAGAAHVCCTLYTVYASEHLKRMTDGLVAGFSDGTDPVEALRRVQVAELYRWRDGRPTYPVLWWSLAYVGVGWDA